MSLDLSTRLVKWFRCLPSFTVAPLPPYSFEDDELLQKVVKKASASEFLVYWMLLFDGKIGGEFLLKLDVSEREGFIYISVESADEGDLDLDIDPFKCDIEEIVRLELKGGEIVLVPGKYGQTTMTMTAKVRNAKEGAVT